MEGRRRIGPWSTISKARMRSSTLAILPRHADGSEETIQESRLSRRSPQRRFAASSPLAVLVSGSAVGYYGPRDDRPLTETDAAGTDFLAQLCVDWEAEASRAERPGTRVVLLRTGIVLERSGGALPEMMRPFRFFVGGPIGSGRRMF
jgi:NAD dependent epimerase/dehydratase family enzyme